MGTDNEMTMGLELASLPLTMIWYQIKFKKERVQWWNLLMTMKIEIFILAMKLIWL